MLMPVVDHALEAHQNGNYDDYLKVVTAELAEQLTRAGFERAYQEVAPQLGRLQSKTFLGSVRRQDNPMLIFSANYAATKDEVVIQIRFRNGSEPPLIDYLWIE